MNAFDLVHCSAQRFHPIALCIVRVLMGAYFFGWIAYDVVMKPRDSAGTKFNIILSNSLIAAALVSKVLIAIICWLRGSNYKDMDHSGLMRFLVRAVWIFSEFTIPQAILTECAVFALLVHAQAEWTVYIHLVNVALILFEFAMSRHYYIPVHVIFEVIFLLPYMCVLALWHHTSGTQLFYSRLPFVWMNVAYYGTLALGNISLFMTLCGFDKLKQHVFKYHVHHVHAHDHEARAPLLDDKKAVGSMSNFALHANDDPNLIKYPTPMLGDDNEDIVQ